MTRSNRSRAPHHLRRRRHHPHHPVAIDGTSYVEMLSMALAKCLDHVTRIQPIMWPGSVTHCPGCGRDIPPGNTAFLVTTSHPSHFQLCYECGEGLAMHLGWQLPETAPWMLPYAGTPAAEPGLRRPSMEPGPGPRCD